MKLTFFCWFFAASEFVLAQDFSPAKSHNIKSRIDSIVGAAMTREKAVGVAIGIVKDGKVFYSKGYGLKELNTTKPVDSLTNFHLASVSKVFVATAIMQLQERGKIDIDHKLLDYITVSRLKDRRFNDVTIRHMLMHMSGFPDIENYHWNKPKFDSLALGRYARKCVETEKLLFDPGSKWEYSNMAFEVLGHVIENISGMPFDVYEFDHVISKSGLSYTDYNYTKIDTARRSVPHVLQAKKVRVASVYPYSREHGPSGTLNSCTHDMCQWMLEMLRIYGDTMNAYNGVLQHKTLMDMWSVKYQLSTRELMGITWPLMKTPLGLCAMHSGLDPGYMSMLQIYPEANMGIIMLVNGDYPRSLYDLPAVIAWTAKDSAVKRVNIPQEQLKKLEGKYISANRADGNWKIEMKLEDGHLTAISDGYRFNLIPVDDGKFINPDDGSSLVFNAMNENAISLRLFDAIDLKKVKN